MDDLREVFIITEHFKGFGFTFLCDSEAAYNYIHPECLEFYWISDPVAASRVDFESLMDKDPFSEEISSDAIRFNLFKEQVAKKVCRKVVKCYDGKFRRRAIVSFKFVIDDTIYNELFVVDNSMEVAGILGKDFKLKI